MEVLEFEQECHSRSKGQCPCIPWVYVLQTVSVCFVDSPYCYKHCSPRVYQRPFPSPNHAIHSLYWRSVTLWLNVLSSCQWCAIDDWETFMPHMAMFTEMVFTLVMVAVKTFCVYKECEPATVWLRLEWCTTPPSLAFFIFFPVFYRDQRETRSPVLQYDIRQLCLWGKVEYGCLLKQ